MGVELIAVPSFQSTVVVAALACAAGIAKPERGQDAVEGRPCCRTNQTGRIRRNMTPGDAGVCRAAAHDKRARS